MTTLAEMNGMTREELIKRLEFAEDAWQKQVDHSRQIQKLIDDHNIKNVTRGYGIPRKPKKRGQLDEVSINHANRDISKTTIAGIVLIAGKAGKYMLDWHRESGGKPLDFLHLLEAVSPWFWIIISLVVAHYLIVLAFKALEEYK